MTNHDETRLSRWSRRKLESGRMAPPKKRGPLITFADDPSQNPLHMTTMAPPMLPVESMHQTPLQKAALDTGDNRSDMEADTKPGTETETEVDIEPEDLDALAKDHGLQSIDSLEADSDFKPFMQGGIPDALKQAAMSRLWRLDKSFGFLDGMNDYDEDFRVIDKLITMLDTNYKIGRGFLDNDKEETTDNASQSDQDTVEASKNSDPAAKTELESDPSQKLEAENQLNQVSMEQDDDSKETERTE